MTTVDEIYNAAMQLTPAEQNELSDRLWALDDAEAPSRLHPDWDAEIQRRSAEMDSGEVVGITYEEMQEHIRETIVKLRANNA